METAKALASAGARIILCSRSITAGEKAIKDEILQRGHGDYIVPKPDIIVKQLDLASLESVKSLAEDVIATEYRLDFVILNAGRIYFIFSSHNVLFYFLRMSRYHGLTQIAIH